MKSDFHLQLPTRLRRVLEHGPLRLATLLGTAAFLLDWATKSWALRNLPGQSFPLGSLTLFIARNDAFAFSSQNGVMTTGLVVVVRMAMILLVVLLSKNLSVLLSRRTACGAALLLAGGLGNSLDLLFRGGAVVDFIGAGPFTFDWAGAETHVHVVFNAADLFILMGVGLLAPLIGQLARLWQRRLAAWEQRVFSSGESSSL